MTMLVAFVAFQQVLVTLGHCGGNNNNRKTLSCKVKDLIYEFCDGSLMKLNYLLSF